LRLGCCFKVWSPYLENVVLMEVSSVRP
jgi:hypothetical protein